MSMRTIDVMRAYATERGLDDDTVIAILCGVLDVLIGEQKTTHEEVASNIATLTTAWRESHI